MKKIDVLMAGVGGQGIILASDILSEVAINAGYDVKKSDALGMSQRGGSVVSNIRLGESVHSPLIKKGDADLLLAFEKLEAARWASYIKPGGVAIVNDQAIPPLSVSSGADVYPDNETVLSLLKRYTKQVYLIPAVTIAGEIGDTRTFNILMLGFLSCFLPMTPQQWEENISHKLPPGVLDINLKAFKAGCEKATSPGILAV